MKRFLHAGEGYAQNPLTYKLLSIFTRYIQTSSPNKFGWLAYPSWVPKVTGMYFLVALLSSMLQHGSRFTRILLVFSLSPTRTTVEADSNNSRRSVEQVSKKLAKNPLKIQKPIYSALAGFFFSQLHYVSHDCLSALKPRSKRLWMHTLCVCVSVFFLCAQNVVANEADRRGDGEVVEANNIDDIKPIHVAQRLPEEFWTTEFQFYDHAAVELGTLEEFRGKTIILAFWSTTCTICINAFPEYNHINTQYHQSVRILPVNSSIADSIQVIDQRFSKLDNSFQTSSVIQDTYLKSLFPHAGVPYYIWINPHGKISAITTGLLLTEENILKIAGFYETL